MEAMRAGIVLATTARLDALGHGADVAAPSSWSTSIAPMGHVGDARLLHGHEEQVLLLGVVAAVGEYLQNSKSPPGG